MTSQFADMTSSSSTSLKKWEGVHEESSKLHRKDGVSQKSGVPHTNFSM